MWFTENAWPPMLIVGLVALICVGIWNSNQHNVYLLAAMACLLIIGGIYAVEQAIVTEGERLQSDVVRLCDEFRKRDDAVFDHFSNTASEWKEVCKLAMKTVEIDNDLRLTDFQTTFTNNNSRANVHFRANATISAMGFKGRHPFRCILIYQRESGAWKIVDVQRLDPIKGEKLEVMAKQ